MDTMQSIPEENLILPEQLRVAAFSCIDRSRFLEYKGLAENVYIEVYHLEVISDWNSTKKWMPRMFLNVTEYIGATARSASLNGTMFTTDGYNAIMICYGILTYYKVLSKHEISPSFSALSSRYLYDYMKNNLFNKDDMSKFDYIECNGLISELPVGTLDEIDDIQDEMINMLYPVMEKYLTWKDI